MPVDLHFRDYGEGSPLVIIHGLFGSGNNWGRLGKELAETHRVILPDLVNHGRSPHRPTMTLTEMADDIAALLDTLDLPSASIAGHSLGGKVAMALALTHPDRVKRLAALDIAPITYPPHHLDLIAAMQAIDLTANQPRDQVDAALAEAVPATGVRQFLMTNLQRIDDHWGWRINLAAISSNLAAISSFPPTPAMAPYSGQTLVLAGEKSHYVPKSSHPTIHRWFPHAQIDYLQGTGHWLHAEQPTRVYRALHTWLSA